MSQDLPGPFCEGAPSPGGGCFHPRTAQKIKLGPLRVEIRSNEPSFPELQYFPECARLSSADPVDYTVSCCSLGLDGPWPMEWLRASHDKTYRGRRFAAGYYLTDHFGAPAYLLTCDRHLWIFATDFGPILWPFVIKFLLTIDSIDRGMLHLKAAAVSLSSRVTLLVGRGGTGKTVLLSQLCEHAGARFLANTHVLVDDDHTVVPVSSTMRVRNDRFFGPLITSRRLLPALKAGEFLADPFSDLGWAVGREGLIHNLCLVDYRTDAPPVLSGIDRKVLLDYMENFSLAVNIYGLREDVLDYLGADVNRFSIQWSAMKSKLERLVHRCRCFHVRCDSTDPENLRQIRTMLEVN